MEIEFNNLSQNRFWPELTRNLLPGDRLSFRVLRRLAPFRYLVQHRGHTLFVTSTELLKPGNIVLLELQQTQPRLKFKFITTFPGNTASANSLSTFRQQGLMGLLESWAVRWELPIKSRDVNRLKHLLRENKRVKQYPHMFLLGYFFFLQNDTEFGEEPFSAFQEWFLGKETPSSRDELADSSPEPFPFPFVPEEGSPSPREITDFFARLLAYFTRYSRDAQSPSTQQWETALNRLFSGQLKGFRRGKWLLLPYPGSRGNPPWLSFWRQHRVHRQKYLDFAFLFSGQTLGSVAVEGRWAQELLHVKLITFPHQEIGKNAENITLRLRKRLNQAGYPTPQIHLFSVQEPFTWIGNLIFGARNKIEVTI